MSHTESSSVFSTITPSDSTPLGGATRGVYIGGDGNLAVKNTTGAIVVFSGVKSGTYIPIKTCFVLSTGTTATNLIALF